MKNSRLLPMMSQVLLIVSNCSNSSGFRGSTYSGRRYSQSIPTFLPASPSYSNNNEESDVRQHEKILESYSKEGADLISQLSTIERTKRALLAEKVEDQIFANAEQLHTLAQQQQESDAKDATFQKTVEIVSQTRVLQAQYRELVSGESSSVLNAMENAMRAANIDIDGAESVDSDGNNCS